jgi:hypothetical protein
MSLESIREKIKKQRRGGCRARSGEALNSAFKEYYTKKAIWQDTRSKKGFPAKEASKDRLE